MTNSLKGFLYRLEGLVFPSIKHDKAILPPKYMRSGGVEFKNDEYYYSSAKGVAQNLQSVFGLNSESRLLDVGCGTGRFAIGLWAQLGMIKKYVGIDVNPKSIEWCKKYIEPNFKNSFFLRINAENELYNPEGEKILNKFQFPFEATSFDIIQLYSVFSHMVGDDVAIYLNEFNRLLPLSGNVFFTTFSENDVPNWEVNPKNYRIDWRGPLHGVRFNFLFLKKSIENAGFEIIKYDYATETDGQSGFYLKKITSK